MSKPACDGCLTAPVKHSFCHDCTERYVKKCSSVIDAKRNKCETCMKQVPVIFCKTCAWMYCYECHAKFHLPARKTHDYYPLFLMEHGACDIKQDKSQMSEQRASSAKTYQNIPCTCSQGTLTVYSCERCHKQAATIYCKTCNFLYCPSCSTTWHAPLYAISSPHFLYATTTTQNPLPLITCLHHIASNN